MGNNCNCSGCGGSGVKKAKKYDASKGKVVVYEIKCSKCNGTGKLKRK